MSEWVTAPHEFETLQRDMKRRNAIAEVFCRYLLDVTYYHLRDACMNDSACTVEVSIHAVFAKLIVCSSCASAKDGHVSPKTISVIPDRRQRRDSSM